jgi:hypothetical protein
MIVQNAGKVNNSVIKILHKKSAADFMQIAEMDIIYIIVYYSWTTAMLLRGARSPITRILDQDVKTYGKDKYLFIHILYNFNIHCFDIK